eukprot:s135_g21.t2
MDASDDSDSDLGDGRGAPKKDGNLQSFLLAVGIGSLFVGGAAGTLLTLAFTGFFTQSAGCDCSSPATAALNSTALILDLNMGPDPVSRTASVARAPEVARQSEKTDKIVDSLKELTLLEASELVKAIEETFGVDASASAGAVVMAAPGAGGGGGAEEAAPEKTEFDVVIKEVPKEKKIAIIKAIRAITGLGLKDAKGAADNPGKVVEAKPKDFCEDAKKQLEEAGAVVEVV